MVARCAACWHPLAADEIPGSPRTINLRPRSRSCSRWPTPSCRSAIVDEDIEGQVPAGDEVGGDGVEGDEAAIGANGGRGEKATSVIALITGSE